MKKILLTLIILVSCFNIQVVKAMDFEAALLGPINPKYIIEQSVSASENYATGLQMKKGNNTSYFIFSEHSGIREIKITRDDKTGDFKEIEIAFKYFLPTPTGFEMESITMIPIIMPSSMGFKKCELEHPEFGETLRELVHKLQSIEKLSIKELKIRGAKKAIQDQQERKEYLKKYFGPDQDIQLRYKKLKKYKFLQK